MLRRTLKREAARSVCAGATAVVLMLTAIGCSTPSARPWGEVVVADAERAVLRTRGDATPRAWGDFPELVVQEPVVVQADEAVSIDFVGREVWVDEEAGAVFGVSPDTLYAFCFDGRLSSAGVEAQPGQVLLWTPANDVPQRYHVDASYVRSTSTVVDLPEFDERLAELEAKQKDMIWWGVLESTGVNAVAATAPEVHAERKTYLQDADVVALRFDPEGPEALAGRVATSFVNALHQADGPRLAKLLSPKLGVEGTGVGVTRGLIAQRLAQQDWSDLQDQAPTATDDPMTWIVNTQGQNYQLKLVPGDGLYYVSTFARQ